MNHTPWTHSKFKIKITGLVYPAPNVVVGFSEAFRRKHSHKDYRGETTMTNIQPGIDEVLEMTAETGFGLIGFSMDDGYDGYSVFWRSGDGFFIACVLKDEMRQYIDERSGQRVLAN